MEAVLAAVYLNAGFETARKVILRLWSDRLKNVEGRLARCQDRASGMGAGAGHAAAALCAGIARNGPDHAPEFEIAVRSGRCSREAVARGTGANADIEQAAAQACLTRSKRDRHDRNSAHRNPRASLP